MTDDHQGGIGTESSRRGGMSVTEIAIEIEDETRNLLLLQTHFRWEVQRCYLDMMLFKVLMRERTGGIQVYLLFLSVTGMPCCVIMITSQVASRTVIIGSTHYCEVTGELAMKLDFVIYTQRWRLGLGTIG